ncbi:MAG: hypothetical protein AAF471_06565 [Myxococcota bacterium]
MLWKSKNQAVALAAVLAALTVGGACGGDGAKGKQATGLDVAKRTKSEYVVEEAKKTSSEIDAAGTKKKEDVRADIIGQVKQWRGCVQLLVSGYSLPDQAIQEWEKEFDRCSAIELGFMREMSDSIVRFTCKVNPQDPLEKVVAASDKLMQTLKESQEKLDISRLCTSGQTIYTEVDKVILIARGGDGVSAASDVSIPGIVESIGASDSKECISLRKKLREDKLVIEEKESEKWKMNFSSDGYKKAEEEIEKLKRRYNVKIDEYINDLKCGYDMFKIF